MGLLHSDLEGALADVANIVMNDGLDVWGFYVFKTWGYKAAEKAEWGRYWARWQTFMGKVLREDNQAQSDLRMRLRASLLDEKSGGVPYVTAVAKGLEDNSKGHFKIAVDVLVPGVWYLLSVVTPAGLDPGDGLIYRGPLTGQEMKDDEERE